MGLIFFILFLSILFFVLWKFFNGCLVFLVGLFDRKDYYYIDQKILIIEDRKLTNNIIGDIYESD